MDRTVDPQRLWEDVARVVRKEGIPRYVREWKYASDSGHTVRDLHDVARRVTEYHPHSTLKDRDGLPVSPKRERSSETSSPSPYPSSPTPAQKELLLRRPTEFAFDPASGIGTITFYTFSGYFMTNEAFRALANERGLALRHQLRDWERDGKLKGLILDLRAHSGGSFWPVLHGFMDYFRGVSAFAWASQPPRAGARAWMTGPAELPARYGKLIAHRGDDSLAKRDTYSSGEIAAAMFQGKPNVRSFG